MCRALRPKARALCHVTATVVDPGRGLQLGGATAPPTNPCANRSANLERPGNTMARQIRCRSLEIAVPWCSTTMIEDDDREGTTVSLWQTCKPQRHAPCGGMGVPGCGRPICLANAESSYPGRWRT